MFSAFTLQTKVRFLLHSTSSHCPALASFLSRLFFMTQFWRVVSRGLLLYQAVKLGAELSSSHLKSASAWVSVKPIQASKASSIRSVMALSCASEVMVARKAFDLPQTSFDSDHVNSCCDTEKQLPSERVKSVGQEKQEEAYVW